MAGVKGNTGRQGLGTASLMKFRANAFRINDNLCLVKHFLGGLGSDDFDFYQEFWAHELRDDQKH
jgi:hypothetical protein